jgi:hypothetical protein
MGVVTAAWRIPSGKAVEVFLHSPKPAQYVVVPTDSRADP